MAATSISKKRKFIADGVFFAELNEFLQRELGEDGYSGVEVRVTPVRTEVIIRATRTQNVLGEKGRRIRELTSLVQKRFNFPEGNVELYAERVHNRALSAIAQAESLRFKLIGGLVVRRACYGVMRYVMENGAKGCEIVIAGKLRAQRAKSMKFRDGYMIKSGDAINHYIDYATRNIQLKQGTLGIRVKIMLPHDPTGKDGASVRLPDVVTVNEPKDEQKAPATPHGQNMFQQQQQPQQQQQQQQQQPVQQQQQQQQQTPDVAQQQPQETYTQQ
jgi:small subunit ribosomal protein S3e